MSDFEAGLIDKEVYTEVVYATYKRPLSARAREYAISEEERLLVLKISIIIMSFHLIFLDYLSLQSLLTTFLPSPHLHPQISTLCGQEQ